MTTTPNLGLTQWELTDEIKMANFNSDNLKIDSAVAGKAPAFTYGTEDIEAGSASSEPNGTLHLVIE